MDKNDSSTNLLITESSIYSKKELDKIIFQLKNHYNEILNLVNSKSKKIEFLNNEESRLNRELRNDSQNEIVINNKNNEKINKKYFVSINRYEELLKKKNEYEQLDLVELAYRKTLTYKIECEKANFNKLNANIDDITEKLKAITVPLKKISNNCDYDIKKSVNLNKLNNDLKDETIKMKQLLHIQDSKILKLKEEIIDREKLLNDKKEILREKNQNISKEINQKKKEIEKNFHETELDNKIKLNKEHQYINITLGLHLIKNYLIDGYKNNVEMVSVLNSFRQSNDYRIFQEYKNPNIHHLNSSSQSLKANTNLLQDDEFNFKGTIIKTYYLKEIYENTELNYQELFDFHTKILNKKNFNQVIITKFNAEQVSLERQREVYYRKIQSMITKNYKNVDLIIKSNSKLENLFKKYQNYSSKPSSIPSKYHHFPELINENQQFCLNCMNFIKEFKLFIEVLFNCTDQIDKERNIDDDSAKKLKLLKSKLKSYTKYSEKIDYHEQDYINSLFSFFENHLNIKDEDYNSTNINLVNIDIKKVREIEKLKKFFKFEKNDYLSINLDHDFRIFYSLELLDNKINDILELTQELIDDVLNSQKSSSYILKTNNTEGIIKYNKDDYLMTNYTTTNIIKKSNHHLQMKYFKYDAPNNNDEEESMDLGFEKIPLRKKVILNRKPPLNKMISASMNKLFKPYMETRKFHVNLNQNNNKFRIVSKENHRELFLIDKKQKDLQKTTEQLFLYNNPNINLEILSNTTYNSFVRQIIINQVESKKPNSQLKFKIIKKQLKKIK